MARTRLVRSRRAIVSILLVAVSCSSTHRTPDHRSTVALSPYALSTDQCRVVTTFEQGMAAPDPAAQGLSLGSLVTYDRRQTDEYVTLRDALAGELRVRAAGVLTDLADVHRAIEAEWRRPDLAVWLKHEGASTVTDVEYGALGNDHVTTGTVHQALADAEALQRVVHLACVAPSLLLPIRDHGPNPPAGVIYLAGTDSPWYGMLRPKPEPIRIVKTPSLPAIFLVVPSPNGQKVAISYSTREAQFQAGANLVITPSGSAVSALPTPIGADLGGASWLPDGSGVLAVDEAKGHHRHLVIDQGSIIRPLTISAPKDGVGVALNATSVLLSGSRDIWRIGMDGSGRRLLASVPSGCYDIDRAVSPDGARYAVAVNCPENQDQKDGIYVGSSTGGPLHRLEAGVTNSVGWSPDGQWLVAAFTPFGSTSLSPNWAFKTDGTAAREILRQGASHVAWGPPVAPAG